MDPSLHLSSQENRQHSSSKTSCRRCKYDSIEYQFIKIIWSGQNSSPDSTFPFNFPPVFTIYSRFILNIYRHIGYPKIQEEGTFNSSKKNFAKNYRPVSLTCIIVRTYKSFLYKHILDQFLPRASVNQHCFLPNWSTVSNFLNCVDIM